ncbi:MAG: HAD family phosphatase [Firmicutes bacterium]|nr:HAD family phosphatase [Bacillota bacterium]
MIRLICADLDGTLLDDEKNIPEVNRKAIQRAREEGVRIVLTSGRPPHSLRRYTKELGLEREGEYCIATNGALLLECGSHRIIREATFGRAQLSFLLAIARQHTDILNPHMYYEEKVLVERQTEATKIYERLSGCRTTLVPDLSEYLDIPMTKMVFCGLEANDALTILQQSLEGILPPEISMFKSADFLLEFVHRDAGKWNAVSALADHLGIQKDQILCIGDNENDMEMVREAGFGGGPANSCDSLKACADYVSIADNNQGGAAEIIAKALNWGLS